jgi:twitching motility protein PilI
MSQSPPDATPFQAIPKPDPAARRNRLRQFQAQLLERMQSARTGTDPRSNLLGVMIGQARCLLDLHEASEIVPIGTITKVPLTQDWYLGLTNIRGNLIGVVDLARFHGLPALTIGHDSRIVAFSPVLAVNCALLVSRVLGLRNVAEMQLQTNNESGTPWSGRCYRDGEQQLWTQLNLSSIVQDQRFLQVG